MGKRFKREGTYAYLWLVHVDVWQKNNNTILQINYSPIKNKQIKNNKQNWSVLPFPSPGDLPHPGLNPSLLGLLHWQAGSYQLSHQRSPTGTTILSNLPKCPSAMLLGKEALGPADQPAKQ